MSGGSVGGGVGGERSGMAGGRFSGEADALFRAFNDSLAVDWRLVQEDVRASVAWAEAITRAGVLTSVERDRLRAALVEVSHEASVLDSPPLASGAEDVHSWVELRLCAKVGDLGKKLHTGRSRNDQVATDLRLWVLTQIRERIAELRALQLALLDAAEAHADTAFPGFTHLQTAQPIVLGHWAMAYVEMLFRDVDRLESAARRADECPLGCGALAGTAYAIDREALARSLGFARATRNSLDAVSDRDLVMDVLSASAMCGVHLSRLAEDLIVYSSNEFALVAMDDAVTSGSSLMPQKKNPDAMELVRAKCGRLLGLHAGLAATLKGLPLAYNKDLQEDKPPVFEAMDQLSMCVRMSARVVMGLVVNAGVAARAAVGGYANATELADYLVSRGVPFREAHAQTGRLVRMAIAQERRLEELPLEAIRSIAPSADEGVRACLSPEWGLGRRACVGGTSPQRVREAIREARARLG